MIRGLILALITLAVVVPTVIVAQAFGGLLFAAIVCPLVLLPSVAAFRVKLAN